MIEKSEKEDAPHRESKKIDLDKTSSRLTEKGYRVIRIEQPWRNVWAQLEKDGQDFFFKMASTPGVGQRLENEIAWNRLVGAQISKKKIGSFTVPQIEEGGHIESLPFYISPFYHGQLLSTSAAFDANGVSKHLDQIVEMNMFITSLPLLDSPRDKKFPDPNDFLADSIAKYQNRAERFEREDLSPVVEMIHQLKDNYRPTVNHGDFTPWHMIDNPDQIVLIDGEHGSSLMPIFYDSAYFYERVYVDGQGPDLAKQYLSLLYQQLPNDLQKEFETTFRPILAVRLIGGYNDARVDQVNDISGLNSLKDDLLTDNLK